MTLALLVIAALSAAGMARRSLQTALDANESQDALQRRWAAASCRSFALQNAESLFIRLEDAERQPRWPAPREFRAEFVLGNFAIQLVLADEDAKANLNSLDPQKRGELRVMLTGLAGGALPLELRPDFSPEAKRRRRAFTSWGQVVDVAAALSKPGGWDGLTAVAGELTCWGDAKPNIRRASDRTIELAATAVAGRETARKLVEARRQCQDDLLLADLLATLDLRRAEQLKLRNALSDRSSCYSLWLALGDGRRHWYHCWVMGDQGAGRTGVLAFHW